MLDSLVLQACQCDQQFLWVFKVFPTEKSLIAHIFISSVSFNIVWMYKTADYHITVCHCMWFICHPLQHVSPRWQLDNDPKVNLMGHQQPHSPLSHCTPSIVKPESTAHSYLHKFKLTATQWIRWWQMTVILNTNSFIFEASYPALNRRCIHVHAVLWPAECVSYRLLLCLNKSTVLHHEGMFTSNSFPFYPQGATLEEHFFPPDETLSLLQH